MTSSGPLVPSGWEIQGADGGTWKALDAQGAEAIKKAVSAGHRAAAFVQDGCCCVLDLEAEVKLNTETGSIRKIRRALWPAPSPPQSSPRVASAEATQLPAKRPRASADGCLAGSALARAFAAGAAAAPGAAISTLEASTTRDGTERLAPMPPSAAPRPPRPDPAAASDAAAVPGDGGEDEKSGNTLLADIFEEMGAVMKLKRDRFRSLAYEKASQAIRSYPEAIVSGAQAKHIEGIGAGMARRIDVVLATGELEELKELCRDCDVLALRELRSVHGIGAVRAAELVSKNVRSLTELRAAVASGKVHLDAVQTIGLKHAEAFAKRIPRGEMMEHEAFLKGIQEAKHPRLVLMICGSYRRVKADCGDIDVLITTRTYKAGHLHENAGGAIIRQFVQSLRDAHYITADLAFGNTKYMGVCKLSADGALHRRIDIRCIRYDQFHYGTLYFTGSKALSVRLRMKAIELGMRLSEYGLERTATKEQILVNSERDIFEALGVEYLEPHER